MRIPWSVVLLTAVAAGGVMLVAGAAGGPGDDQPVVGPGPSPAPGPAGPSTRPDGVMGVRPAEGSRVCRTPDVGATLRVSEAMQRQGAFDPSSVSLRLDGADVTRQTSMATTMVYPAARVILSYRPATRLAPGPHRASVIFSSRTGKTTYTWSFLVEDRPCR